MNLSDPHLLDCIRAIVKQTNVGLIVETGTYHGETTAWLATEFATTTVWTFENNLDHADIAKMRLDKFAPRVALYRGSSDELLGIYLLPSMLGLEKMNESVLLLLDAHFDEHWPLLNELKTVNACRAFGGGHKMTVLVDDFFTDRPNFQGCYGGLRGDDGGLSAEGNDGKPLIRCGYNEPFSSELDRFPHCWYPDYPEPSLGYVVVTDFDLDLGEQFRRVR